MSKRDSFIFYRSFFEATLPLDQVQKSELFNAICEYALNQTETEMQPMVKAMFGLIKPQLEANYKRYLNGKKGGKPKVKESKPEPKRNQNVTKSKPNENVNDNVNDNSNEINKVGKPPVFQFKKSCIDYGFEKNLVEDWMKVRKTKRLTNTETALRAFIGEVEKTGKDKNELLKEIVENGWAGFKASWLDKGTNDKEGRYIKENITDFKYE